MKHQHGNYQNKFILQNKSQDLKETNGRGEYRDLLRPFHPAPIEFSWSLGRSLVGIVYLKYQAVGGGRQFIGVYRTPIVQRDTLPPSPPPALLSPLLPLLSPFLLLLLFIASAISLSLSFRFGSDPSLSYPSPPLLCLFLKTPTDVVGFRFHPTDLKMLGSVGFRQARQSKLARILRLPPAPTYCSPLTL